MTAPNLVALAVDGMEPSLLERWIDAGELPNLRALREAGTYGTAHCSSLSSAKQWTTHFTGVDAGTHGVMGFTRTGGRRAGDDAPDARELINLSDIRVKTYPELLSEAGIRVGLINPLPLWPPLELEGGFCVSGMLTPPTTDRWVHPPELEPELEELGYRIDVRYGDRPYGFVDDAIFAEVDLETLHAEMFEVLEARIRATKWAVETRDVDYLYSLLKSIDVIQHCFWTHMTHDDPTYGDAILESYRRVDDLVGWLREETDATLLVFSDHGFQAREAGVVGPVDRLARAVDERVTVPGFIERLYARLLKSEVSVSTERPERTTGDHANPAAWIAAGPDVAASEPREIRFEDVPPTILALLGEPVPRDYVGEPLEAITVGSSRADVPLETDRQVSVGTDEVVSERLHNLGYADMVDE